MDFLYFPDIVLQYFKKNSSPYKDEKYLIVLEPQRSGTACFLLSAYYLNREYGVKEIKKKQKRKLPDIY
jgi:hypothetical protein